MNVLWIRLSIVGHKLRSSVIDWSDQGNTSHQCCSKLKKVAIKLQKFPKFLTSQLGYRMQQQNNNFVLRSTKVVQCYVWSISEMSEYKLLMSYLLPKFLNKSGINKISVFQSIFHICRLVNLNARRAYLGLLTFSRRILAVVVSASVHLYAMEW